MQAPEKPRNEADRLRDLRAYEVLDTPPDAAFDALTSLAAHIAGVPIALVSLVDADRQWFMARYGLDTPETPRDVSFCAHVVAADAPLVVSDARTDERFSDNPLVTGDPRIRFYAGFPLRSPRGSVLGTLCTIDTQARQLSEKQHEMLALLARQAVDQLELRRRSRQLETQGRFFEMSLSLLCTADLESMCFQELNPAWERSLGWTLAELRSRPFLELIHPDDLAPTLAVAERLLSGSITVDFQNRYRHKDGHWVPLAWHAIVGDGVAYAGAVDLTELRRKDAARLESEMRYRSIVDSAVDAVITIDEYGIIDSVNPAVERLFGHVPAELIGQNVNVLVPSPEHERHDGYLANYRATGVRTVIGAGREISAARKDGSTFPAELSVSEFFLQGQRYFTGIVRDISDRKRVERLQSEFVSTVSHELRTPLTSIRGALGLVSAGVTGPLPVEAKEYVDIALSNSDRLVRLINDILDIEKVQSGSLEFRLRAMPLAHALRSAVAATTAFAVSHGVRLALTEPLPTGEVLVDPDRLAQVLANLLSNAVKFSPQNGVVEVGAHELGTAVRVSVRDWGPGIPEDFRQRIFQRFAQADASNTRQKGGTGLGLAISRAIVEKMRGKIGFDAAPGGGTVFHFELPYFPAVDRREEAPKPQLRVLVCEDDPDVLRLLERLLTTAGYAVDLAPTIERARRLLEAHTYDAVTLDLILADGESSALIQELRGSEVHRLTPIVVVSGSEGRLGTAAVAVADIIVKPVDETRLLTVIQNATATCWGSNPRLLHVEDNGDVRRIVRRTLPSSWTVVGADSVGAARRALAETEFDVVMLDLALPDGAGDELLGLVGRARVVIFSASDPSADLARRVAASLVKSRATPVDVRNAILALLPRPRAGGAP